MKAQPWNKGAVREMLLKPRNAGLRKHQGQILGAASWPAIVPEDQWRAVVTILTDPARRTTTSDNRVKWLGSGIYVCAGCERPSLRASTAGHGAKIYRCNGSVTPSPGMWRAPPDPSMRTSRP